MALIACPECRKKISDKATTCPSCGFPIGSADNLNVLNGLANFYSQAGKAFRVWLRHARDILIAIAGLLIFLFFFIMSVAAAIEPTLALLNAKSSIEVLPRVLLGLLFLIGFGYVSYKLLIIVINIAAALVVKVKEK